MYVSKAHVKLGILTVGLRFGSQNILLSLTVWKIAPHLLSPPLTTPTHHPAPPRRHSVNSLVQGRRSIPFCYCLVLLT